MLSAPAAHETSFGRVAGTAPPGTRRIVVRVDGVVRASRPLAGRSFDLKVDLPLRDVGVQVTAVARRGSSSTTVRPVFGLPRAARGTGTRGWEDARLARRVRSLARGFGHACGVYLQDLSSGAGAAWNARARFPAASTLKLAIAVEALRSLGGKPRTGTRVDRLLRSMIQQSDNDAANDLQTLFGGSTYGGSARVNALMRALGLDDSEMYGGYERDTAARRRPLPLRVDDAPDFGRGKHTSAFDLGSLLRYVYLAADGRGPLRERGVRGPDARYLLYLLAHVRDPGKLDRFLGGRGRLLHKGGWLSRARHDNGIVLWRGGAFVVTVMTWRPGGAGGSSDVLAGKVAARALELLRRHR